MKKNNQIMSKKRIVKDTMGSINVPADALYGAQTQRAINNFPISDTMFLSDFIKSIVNSIFNFFILRF